MGTAGPGPERRPDDCDKIKIMAKLRILRKKLENGFRYLLPTEERRRIKTEFGEEPEGSSSAYIFWQEGMGEEVYYRFSSMEKKVAENLCGGNDVLDHFGGFAIEPEEASEYDREES
jgi:hypothetical protein